MSTSVKVTSYNVLSSSLCEPNYFQACNPEFLAPTHRLNILKQKLDKETDTKAVVCLQEVSTLWAGELHTYFSKKGYHFVTGLYGNKFDGYMGVGMAVPLAEYEISDVNIARIADTKRMARKPKTTGILNKAFEKLEKIYVSTRKILGFHREVPELWDSVTYRHNQMICMRLKSKATNQVFAVGTYHMPCMFKMPSVMVTHCALSAQHLQRFAGEDPYVFAGDFNIKPDSSMYRLMTEGTIDEKVRYFCVISSTFCDIFSFILITAPRLPRCAGGRHVGTAPVARIAKCLLRSERR